MDNYKLINKELITQVQEMRTEIALYKQQLIEHKAEIMEERRLRVEQKHRLVALLTQNFKETLEDVYPEVNIASLFTDATNKSSINSRHTKYTRSSAFSSEIISDFRRSLSLHRRTSSTKMSPVRRTSKSIEQAEIEYAENITTRESLENTESMPDDGSTIDKECNVQPSPLLHLEKIIEEESSPKKVISIHGKKKILESSIASQPSPLRDLTNIQSPDASFDKTNTPKLVVRRGKIYSYQEESIEAVRFANEVEKPYIANMSIDSASFAISEISIGKFCEAPSSTPSNIKVKNSNFHNTIKKQISNDDTLIPSSYESSNLTNNTHNSRPQRNCAHKSYVEPNLKTKIRSETARTKKKQKKGKSRT